MDCHFSCNVVSFLPGPTPSHACNSGIQEREIIEYVGKFLFDGSKTKICFDGTCLGDKIWSKERVLDMMSHTVSVLSSLLDLDARRQ